MKKVLFLLVCFVALGFAANAQSCSGGSAMKACCAGKAAKAASADATIEKRTDVAGAVSYVRKEADAQGNVQFVSVQFDEAANAFVNVAPKGMTVSDKSGMVKKSACSAGEKKACCAPGSAAGKSCGTANKAAVNQ